MNLLTHRVQITPDIGEGFYDAIGVGRPQPFVAEVGDRQMIYGMPTEGWVGSVVEGQGAYRGKRVALHSRLVGSTESVVAYIFDTENEVGGSQIFSGICSAHGLEKSL